MKSLLYDTIEVLEIERCSMLDKNLIDKSCVIGWDIVTVLLWPLVAIAM